MTMSFDEWVMLSPMIIAAIFICLAIVADIIDRDF